MGGIIDFNIYKNQVPVVERALETTALMLAATNLGAIRSK